MPAPDNLAPADLAVLQAAAVAEEGLAFSIEMAPGGPHALAHQALAAAHAALVVPYELGPGDRVCAKTGVITRA
jgi:hypothetical protein